MLVAARWVWVGVVLGVLASGVGGRFFGVVVSCGVAGARVAGDTASLVDLAVDDTGGVTRFEAAALSLRVG